MTARFLPSVGRKWTASGAPLRFRGNTVVAMIPQTSTFFTAATEVHDRVAASEFASAFAFVPPSSFHMTVLDLVREQDRLDGGWPVGAPPDASLEEVDMLMNLAVASVQAPEQPRMRVAGLPANGNLQILLDPADEREDSRLRHYRSAVLERTRTPPPPADYRFHVTLAYRLRELEPAEQDGYRRLVDDLVTRFSGRDVIALETPGFYLYDDMLAYRRFGERRGGSPAGGWNDTQGAEAPG